MKTQKNILIALLLNLSFAVFELIGGMVTGSVAILSDALQEAIFYNIHAVCCQKSHTLS